MIHSASSASESGPVNATIQPAGKASPAMNMILSGTTTDETDVPAKAPASMRINSESRSNEIDKSESQDEKHDEPRICT
jgi:hypothetical protein